LQFDFQPQEETDLQLWAQSKESWGQDFIQILWTPCRICTDTSVSFPHR